MKEKITNNLKLKIIAVLFAAGLWMISININDPYQSKDYSVVVQILNTNLMTAAGKYVEVANRSDEITVRVRGNRSVMDNFTASNIVATADLNELDADNRIPIKLSTLKTSGSKIESIRSTDTYVEVNVENITRVQKKLEVATKNQPEEGYILGKISTEQNALRISGPESAVALVEKAVVNFDLAQATEDVSMILPVELYDAQGNKINDSRLTTSIEEVQCVASILATKEIPLSYTVKGEALEGYSYTGEILSEPSGVLVAAKSSVLRTMRQLEITEPIDIQDVKENVTVTLDVKEYLPENVILADASYDGKVTATAVIEETFTQEVKIAEEQIHFINIPEGLEAKLKEEEKEYLVKVTGYVSQRADFKEEDIKAEIDIQSYIDAKDSSKTDTGIHEIELKLDMPEGIWQEESVLVEVKISEK